MVYQLPVINQTLCIAVVLNLLSLRTGKPSKQILRAGGLSKSTQNVITTKIYNSKEV